MSTYTELISRFDQLKQEIERTRVRERERYLRELIKVLEVNGVSLDDLISYWTTKVKTPVPRVRPKYFDPVTGRTWAGRGREPAWIRGKDRNQFLIRHFNEPEN
ncbi:H-NS family nucleoid-associated regulatory protein [Burkholderia cepacia]|uniref:H-NS histone family protein n=1 Tax=Burkholderia cepacia TaxID=292 RepID=UPI0009BBBB08|nr:H-NS histone family protein [Burkholderia cepacia]